MKVLPVLFEQHEIRRVYDEKTETWFFSVVDIIQVLTQQPDYQAAKALDLAGNHPHDLLPLTIGKSGLRRAWAKGCMIIPV